MGERAQNRDNKVAKTTKEIAEEIKKLLLQNDCKLVVTETLFDKHDHSSGRFQVDVRKIKPSDPEEFLIGTKI